MFHLLYHWKNSLAAIKILDHTVTFEGLLQGGSAAFFDTRHFRNCSNAGMWHFFPSLDRLSFPLPLPPSTSFPELARGRWFNYMWFFQNPCNRSQVRPGCYLVNEGRGGQNVSEGGGGAKWLWGGVCHATPTFDLPAWLKWIMGI